MSQRGPECKELVQYLQELREILRHKLLTTPEEERERMAYLNEISKRERQNAVIIEKLEGELKEKNDDKDEEVCLVACHYVKYLLQQFWIIYLHVIYVCILVRIKVLLLIKLLSKHYCISILISVRKYGGGGGVSGCQMYWLTCHTS